MKKKIRQIAGIISLLGVLALALSDSAMAPTPAKEKLPPLSGATQWLNSLPLSPADLRGKVVVVEFWTYTCVNWRRTLPYVRAWAEKYKDQGVVVVGVHTPEFSFEKEAGNVRQAVKDMKIGFPVAMDNNYVIWNAFRNEYWPALYFVDARGNIRHHQFGEGNYDQSERVIQQLLKEAGVKEASQKLAEVNPVGAEVAADQGTLQSFETYLGVGLSSNFASPGGARANRPHLYTAPRMLSRNEWALSGTWTMGQEADVLNEGDGRIIYRFHARDVNLVMGLPGPRKSVRFRVLIDGKAPGPAHGVDVDSEGNGTLNEQRMYQLIRQPPPIADRQVEIEFSEAGAES